MATHLHKTRTAARRHAKELRTYGNVASIGHFPKNSVYKWVVYSYKK